jgi:hypothetical protein
MSRLFLLSLLAVCSALPQFYPYQAGYPYPGYYGVYPGVYPGYYPVYDQSASTRTFVTLSSFQVPYLYRFFPLIYALHFENPSIFFICAV